MENWKRGLLAGSAGLAALFLVRGNRTASMIFGGVALATLASEYPDKFADIRRRMPEYVERGSNFLDVVSRAGERLADLAERRGGAWYEALMEG
jgi:hypothetical protein